MTIKEFAMLCNCNPQTLRYYDKLDLLKPAKVDSWTGYRYYNESQALDFVKIKNLQEADFSIKEIKELLLKSDEEIYRAFERKIKEQLAKVEQIRKIQSTYLSEKQTMEAKIREIKNKVMESAAKYDPVEEFGISREYYQKLMGNVNDLFEKSIRNMGHVDFTDVDWEAAEHEEEQFQNPLESGEYVIVFEKHGWMKTKEVLEELPKIGDADYFFYFELEKSKMGNMAFCNVILGYALEENKGKKLNMGCNCTDSKDGENHFWLLKKK